MTVTIREDNSGSPSNAVLYTLTTPTTLGAADNEYTAPLGAVVSANTTYHMVASYSFLNSESRGPRIKTTYLSVGLDPGTASGWNIDATYRIRAHGADDSTAWTEESSIRSITIAVKGTTRNSATNTPATGVPTVSGVAQTGQTLTAGIGDMADADGLPMSFPGDYRFQWVRENTDGTNPTDISGATSSTYTLVEADVGKKMKVRVSFADDDGNVETLTSVATSTVFAEARSCTPGAVWCGKLTVGQKFAAGPRPIGYCNSAAGRCADGYGSLDDEDFTLASVTYIVESVRWESDGTKNLHLTLDQDFPTAGLPGLTLKVRTLSFELSEASRGNNDNTVDNNYRWNGMHAALGDENLVGTQITAELLLDPDSAATGGPTITGTATGGETLTAAIGDIADTNGLPPTFPDDYSFQWVRVDADGVSNPTDIPGATASTYTLSRAEEGKKIKVKVSFSDALGYDEEVTSTPYPSGTDTIAPTANVAPTGAPTISGTAQALQTLTAGLGTIADSDGLPATFPDDYTFQWVRVDADGTSNPTSRGRPRAPTR